jgi:hypothetical protein
MMILSQGAMTVGAVVWGIDAQIYGIRVTLWAAGFLFLITVFGRSPFSGIFSKVIYPCRTGIERRNESSFLKGQRHGQKTARLKEANHLKHSDEEGTNLKTPALAFRARIAAVHFY